MATITQKLKKLSYDTHMIVSW